MLDFVFMRRRADKGEKVRRKTPGGPERLGVPGKPESRPGDPWRQESNLGSSRTLQSTQEPSPAQGPSPGLLARISQATTMQTTGPTRPQEVRVKPRRPQELRVQLKRPHYPYPRTLALEGGELR